MILLFIKVKVVEMGNKGFTRTNYYCDVMWE